MAKVFKWQKCLNGRFSPQKIYWQKDGNWFSIFNYRRDSRIRRSFINFRIYLRRLRIRKFIQECCFGESFTRFVGWLQNRLTNLGSTQNGRPAPAKFFLASTKIVACFRYTAELISTQIIEKFHSFISMNHRLMWGSLLPKKGQLLQAWKIFVILKISWQRENFASKPNLSDFPITRKNLRINIMESNSA